MAYKQPYKSAILRVDPPDDKIDIYSKKNKSRGRKIAETKYDLFKTKQGDLTRDEMRQIANTGYAGPTTSTQIEKIKEKDPETGFNTVRYDKVTYDRAQNDNNFTKVTSLANELSRTSLNPKEIKGYLKSENKIKNSKGEKGPSGYRQMRDEIKYTKPGYVGSEISSKNKKIKREKWVGIDGRKNKIKNKYGRGRFKQQLEGKGLEKGMGKSPDTKSNQSFCTATGNCT